MFFTFVKNDLNWNQSSYYYFHISLYSNKRPDLNVRNKYKGRTCEKDDPPKLCGIPFEGVKLHHRRKYRKQHTEGSRPKFYLGKQTNEGENTFYQKMTSCMSEVPYL